ncbi:MAG: hypothetical protein F4X72_01725 [Dehalococcoidia bacterium]|nr:hypothetical protein [Dehalococcoidia bacterium]
MNKQTRNIGVQEVIGLIVTIGTVMLLLAETANAAGPDYRDPETIRQLLTDLGNAADPVAAFNALPEEAQDAVVWASTPVGEESEVIVLNGAVDSDDMPACRRHIRKKHKTNPFGWKIATYTSDTWWCRLDGEIHGTPEFNPSGQVHRLFRATWRFAGHDYTQESIATDRTWHEDEAQGRFQSCLPIRGIRVCINAWTITITKTHYGNGTQTWSWS